MEMLFCGRFWPREETAIVIFVSGITNGTLKSGKGKAVRENKSDYIFAFRKNRYFGVNGKKCAIGHRRSFLLVLLGECLGLSVVLALRLLYYFLEPSNLFLI